MTTAVAATAGNQVAAVVENAIAAVDGAVESAEARAVAAEDAARLVMEGVAARAVVERVDDIEERAGTCENEIAALQATVESLSLQLTELAATVAALQTKITVVVPQPLTSEALPEALPPLTAPEPEPAPIVATVELNSPSAGADAPEVPATPAKKPSRFRVT